jgi:NADH/F420H2 dehydrogenase subunit C
MDAAGLLAQVKSRFPDAQEAPAPDPKWIRNEEPQVKVPASRVADVAGFFKNDLGFDFLTFVTAVDWIKENRFEMVYHFMKTGRPQDKVFLKADLPRQGEPEVPSLTLLWTGADWQEREIFDLYGIRFAGHPNLRRILLWDGYQGYPLRKDYVHVPDKYDNGEEIGVVKPPMKPGGETPAGAPPPKP